MIKSAIFFNDFSLYVTCEISAKKCDQKTDEFIVNSVLAYLQKNSIETGKIKKPIDLWIACDILAKQRKLTICQVIEDACKDALAPADKKESWLDKLRLPTG